MNFLTSTFSFRMILIVVQKLIVFVTVRTHFRVLQIVKFIMKSNDRQSFSIKCECIIMRNNLPINTKKKSKFSVLQLNPEEFQISVTPFGSSKEEEKAIAFPISKLRAIHKKYIEEGKMTLQFFEKTERVSITGIDVSAKDNIIDIFSSILISSASKENLELMLSKIIELKKSQQPKEHKKKVQMPDSIPAKPQQKKRLNVSELPNLPEPAEKFNRKDLRAFASNPTKPRPKQPKKSCFDFFDIPCSLRATIFEFCSVTLEMRLINKKFSTLVLEKIHSIRFKEDIDEPSFNKLAMWAVNVQGRMKNIRSITLKDKHEEQELKPNRAKTLKFGQWRQITAKNITQIKGLRIYCLELPYSIKFDLSHLFGQRLVQLRFKGAPFSRNEFIKVDDIAHILNNIREVKALQLPFCTSNLFSLLDHPKRLQELTVYSISDNLPNSDWTDFSRFQNLLIFRCWYLQKGGARKERQEINFQFPSKLRSLQIGSFLSSQGIEKLPFNLHSLMLIGEFYNSHLQNMVLPFLKHLDVSQAKNIRAEVIDFLKNITLITSWDRNTVDYMNRYAVEKNILLESVLAPLSASSQFK